MSGVALPAIRCRQAGKKFSASCRHSIAYGLADIARTAFGMRLATDRLRPREFWALEDVSFEVQPGEMLGLIGSNGAGKSTLLKLLNGIFPPDAGEIEVRGRPAAIIELGAGFHPMLSGLENIFINGMLVGLTRAEVDERLPHIIEFAGIPDRFLDAPLRMYSSGMKARLGFAVASQLKPDLLLIDEVLAVGDLAFQEKCMRRMDDLRSRRTAIVFVTHSPYQVEAMCDRALWLEHGRIAALGRARDVVSAYLDAQERKAHQDARVEGRRTLGENRSTEPHRAYIDSRVQRAYELTPEDVCAEAELPIEIHQVRLLNDAGDERTEFPFKSAMAVQVTYRAMKPIENPLFNLRFLHQGRSLFEAGMLIDGHSLGRVDGTGVLECRLPELPLTPNRYEILLFVRGNDGVANLTRMGICASFRISDERTSETARGPMGLTHLRTGGLIVVPYEWCHWRQTSQACGCA